MEEDRLNDFSKKKAKLMRHENTISEIINIKQSNIELESETIGFLNRSRTDYSYLNSILSDIPEARILEMDDGDYSALVTPAASAGISGEVYDGILKDTRTARDQYEIHHSSCASVATLATSATSGYRSMYETNPDWFPNGACISQQYRIEDSLHKEISFIGGYLKNHMPSIAGDYELFIAKFNAFKVDNSKYQDLIGSRSLFFFKMIYDFSNSHFGFENPRRKAIEAFVFGRAKVPSLHDPIIANCLQVYRDLSSQDLSGQSAKLGKVTPQYVEAMFRTLIGAIAAILQLREKYYTP